MRKLLLQSLAIACAAALPLSASAAPAAPAGAAAFDPARVHAEYQAGDFEKVIRALEAFRESGRSCRKADSVFLEKHLAVVYAADPATRERGRYHMLRMLALEPEADLLDMFVGEEVDGIFEKVRKESRVRRMAVADARPAPAPPVRKGAAPRAVRARPAPAPVPRPAPSGTRPAARLPRPAFPDPGPAPRLKPWNLDPVPAPRRPPRKAGASRAPVAPEAAAAGAAHRIPAAAAPSAPSVPSVRKAAENPRRMAMPAPSLRAWDLDRTVSSGAAMGVLPPVGTFKPVPPDPASHSRPATPAQRTARAAPAEAAEAAGTEKPEGAEKPADGTEPKSKPKPNWKDSRLWVGGTAVAAVLGLTAFYLGSQDWSEPASKSRTYGVAAKPNGN